MGWWGLQRTRRWGHSKRNTATLPAHAIVQPQKSWAAADEQRDTPEHFRAPAHADYNRRHIYAAEWENYVPDDRVAKELRKVPAAR